MRRMTLGVVAVSLVLVGGACETDEGTSADAGSTTSGPQTPDTGEQRGAVALSLSWEPDPLAAGAGATFVVSVSNLGDSPAELEFASGQRADVELLEAGESVWRWSDGRAFTQVFGTVTLPAGETMQFELPVDALDVEPGAYDVRATLSATDSPPPIDAEALVEAAAS